MLFVSFHVVKKVAEKKGSIENDVNDGLKKTKMVSNDMDNISVNDVSPFLSAVVHAVIIYTDFILAV